MTAATTSAVGTDRPFSRPDTERELKGLVRLAAIVLAVTFGIGGTWSVLATLSGAVIASGVMKVEANTKLVQHLEGGIVRRIMVKEGQQVRAGQPVVELEDTEASSSLSIVNDQLDAELAKLARLRAEIDNASKIRFPEELLARKSDPNLQHILQREEDHFKARNALVREQISRLTEQRQQTEAEIESFGRQLGAADASLGYLREQEKSYQGLVEKNFIAPAKMLDVRRSVSEKEEKEVRVRGTARPGPAKAGRHPVAPEPDHHQPLRGEFARHGRIADAHPQPAGAPVAVQGKPEEAHSARPRRRHRQCRARAYRGRRGRPARNHP